MRKFLFLLIASFSFLGTGSAKAALNCTTNSSGIKFCYCTSSAECDELQNSGKCTSGITCTQPNYCDCKASLRVRGTLRSPLTSPTLSPK